MSRLARSCRALAVGLAAAAATLSMTQVAHADPAGRSLPPNSPIAVDTANNQVFLVGHAKGVQIYKCDGTAWKFVEPRAELVDDNGKLVATHFAGPTWRATDGSTVVGSVEERATPDATAIPWLRLKATSTTPGQFGSTTYIQRVETKHGLAPAAPSCNAATVDKIHEVPYKADYYFWKASA